MLKLLYHICPIRQCACVSWVCMGYNTCVLKVLNTHLWMVSPAARALLGSSCEHLWPSAFVYRQLWFHSHCAHGPRTKLLRWRKSCILCTNRFCLVSSQNHQTCRAHSIKVHNIVTVTVFTGVQRCFMPNRKFWSTNNEFANPALRIIHYSP